MIRRLQRLWIAVLLGLAIPVLAGAQRLLGPPLDVNVSTAAPVRLSSLAMNARGDFVVTWIQLPVHVGEFPSLLARGFAADGTPRTDVLAVASQPDNTGPDSSRVAMNDDGSFVVILPRFPDLVARGYGPDGTFEGESVVASPASDLGYGIASRASGGFVLVWMRQGRIFTRILARGGEPTGPERQVGQGGPPVVAAGPAGEFVVAWTAFKPDPEDPRYADPFLVAQRFDSAAARVGGRILVQPPTPPGAIAFARAAKDEDGNFLVLWQGRIGTEEGLYARRFAVDGTPRTGLLKLEGATASRPELAMDRAGNFVVAWLQLGVGPNGQTGAFAQRFTAAGTPFRPAFRVDTSGSGEPLVASDAGGNFVVAGSKPREILAWRYRKR